jgi:DNA-binding transcriptional LysR family regulator
MGHRDSKTSPITSTSTRLRAEPGLDANALELFARVVQAGSFAQAARQLGQTRAAVSRRIASIEAQVGQPLLARTTRSLGLTEPGRRLAQRAKAVLDASEAARASLRATSAALAGRLRITAVPSFGRAVLVPLLAAFRREHPGVQFELLFTDRRVDLLRDGVDVAFRITRQPPEDWVAESVMPFSVGAYAAPGAIAPLQAPSDLMACPLLLLGQARESLTLSWRSAQGGETSELAFDGRGGTFSEDMDSLVGLARAGSGVVIAPSYCVKGDLATGALVDVLPGWHLPVPEGDAVMALTLPHPLVGEAARSLVRFVRQRLTPIPPPTGAAAPSK